MSSKLQNLPEATTLDDADLVYVVTDPSGTPTDNKITQANFKTALNLAAEYEPLVTPISSYKSNYIGGWTSALQGYILAETLGYDLETELQNSGFTGSLKPLWLNVGTGGIYTRTDQGIGNEWGWSTTNQTLFERYSGAGLMPNVSASYSGSGDVFTMMASQASRAIWINAAVADAVAKGWRGISVDIEGFGSWSGTQATNFYAFCTELSAALHDVELLCQVYIPPIWNTSATPASVDIWQQANSSGYYPNLTYAGFNAITNVDFWEIAMYDFEFDYGSEYPEAPLGWIRDTVNYARSQFTNPEKLVFGIAAQEHFGADGFGDFNNWTYSQAAAQAQFSQAARDTTSGELHWKPSTINYWAADSTTMDIRRRLIEYLGIKNVSIWYIGNGMYPNLSRSTTLPTSQPIERFTTSYEATGRFVNTTVNTGTVTYSAAGMTLSTGATSASSQRNLFTFLNDSNTYPVFANTPTLEMGVSVTTPITRVGQWYGGLGNITVAGAGHTFTGAHMGFKLVGNGSTTTLLGTIANGTTEATFTLCTVAANDNLKLKAVMNYGGTVDFSFNKNFTGWTHPSTIASTLSPFQTVSSPYIQQSVSNVSTANVFTVVSTGAAVTYPSVLF